MNPTEQELRDIAKRRVEARSGFIIHATMYIVANLGFLLIWAISGAGYPWFLWPLIGWGIAIAAHALALTIGPGSAHEQHAIERELQRLHPSPHH